MGGCAKGAGRDVGSNGRQGRRPARQGRSPESAFEATLAHTREALRLAPGPDRQMLLVAAHLRRAEWRLDRTGVNRAEVVADVARGIEAAEAVLEDQPDRPEALADHARLCSLRARLSADSAERRRWLDLARASAASAVQTRPHLASEFEEVLAIPEPGAS